MFRTRVGQCWSCFHGAAGEELFLRSSRVRIKDKRGACSSPPMADCCCLSTGCCLAWCSRGRGGGPRMWAREQMKNEALLLSSWTSSVSLGKCASVSAAFILLVLKAALLRSRQCFQRCTCQPRLRSCQMPLGAFLYYFIYIYFMLLNIYIYIKKHAATDGFETPFLSCVFQVSTNNSSWHFLVFHYSSALSTYSTLAKLFTFLLSSSLREKRVLFHLLYFWALIFLGGDAWTTAELWVAFPAFRESHRVTSQLSYITLPLLCEPKLAVREATCFVSLLKWSG